MRKLRFRVVNLRVVISLPQGLTARKQQGEVWQPGTYDSKAVTATLLSGKRWKDNGR